MLSVIATLPPSQLNPFPISITTQSDLIVGPSTSTSISPSASMSHQDINTVPDKNSLIPSSLSTNPIPISTIEDVLPFDNTTLPLNHIVPNNIHPMQTRSKTASTKPRVLHASIDTHDHSAIPHLPKSVIAALQSTHLKEAMLAKYRALVHHKTWSLVELPPNKKVVSCKWIFALKKNAQEQVVRHKARLVARGYTQTAGVDFDQVFSPVIKPVTIRIILTLALSKGWIVK
ncbi:hypothetical protein AHAS_Ahas17G0287600 [Arachis hypogaea]